MSVYVRAPGQSVWHWCTSCAYFPSPAGRIEERQVVSDGRRPDSGVLCEECLENERRGTCRELGDASGPGEPRGDKSSQQT